MRHGFLVTSTIEPNYNAGFKHSPIRSALSPQERLRQTIAGLLNLNLADPEARIFLVDTSPNRYTEIDALPNVTYIQLKDLDPITCELTNSHTSKSHCESLILKFFLEQCREELDSLDFITKISARYLLDSTFSTSAYTKENLDKFFFKDPIAHPVEFLRPEFTAVLPYSLIVDHELRGFYTCAYGVGRGQFDLWRQLLNQVIFDTETQQSKFYYVDIEYMMYYYLYQIQSLTSVVHIDWKIHCWGGQDGAYGCV